MGLIFVETSKKKDEIMRRRLREELERRVELACEMGLEYITISTGLVHRFR
jgi:sugar phosphate isomerase/epimerase